MISHNLIQGSDQWEALRAGFRTASEAPAVMAASSKIKRDELLSIKAGFSEREYSEWVQKNLFDKGHESEAMARPIAERIIGEDLYPVTGTNGEYLASFDGLTMLHDTGFEHKMWNEVLAEAVRNKDLPAEYYWQLEHQLLVCSDMEKVLFVVSDGTEDKFVSMEYYRVPGRAEQLVRGWDQFESDRKTFVPVVDPAKPEPDPIEAFPALSVVLAGEVKNSNLPAFKSKAMAFIDSINTDLQTDDDFANAENAVKFCEKAEKEIDLVKSQALGQTKTIDELFREMDHIKELLRQKRLMLDKLVKARKESLKNEIIAEARDLLMADMAKANDEFRPVVIQGIVADFAGAAKNKRTFSSLRSSVNDELSRVRIALSEKRDHVRAAIKIISDAGAEYRSLFNDIQQLVDRPLDYIAMVVDKRVADHKAAENARIEAEAQRRAAAILAEEKRKEEAEAKAKADAEAAAQKLAQDKIDQAEKSVQEAVSLARKAGSIEPDLLDEVSAVAADIAASARPAPTLATSRPAPAKAERPSAAEIIVVLADHYKVGPHTIAQWLNDLTVDDLAVSAAANY